jgi:acyl carrier protein
MDNTLDQVAEIVAKILEHTIGEVKEAQSLEEVDMDSLDLMEIVIDVEKEFDLAFEDDELKGIETLGALVALVERHQVKAKVTA